jgi:hypothetical protein
MNESKWLWRYLNIPLGTATAAAIGVHFLWPAAGFWVNLATTLVGTIVAVNYVDRVLRRHTQLEWRGAVGLIAKRLQTVCCGAITEIRISIGLSADRLSNSSARVFDTSSYMKVCELEIEPAVDGLVRNLDRAEWKRLANALERAYRDLQDLLAVFGAKLRASEFREILALQDDLRGTLIMWSTFPDLLGVPDAELPTNRYGDQIEFKHHMTRQLAGQVSSIVTRLRKLGLSALEFEKAA